MRSTASGHGPSQEAGWDRLLDRTVLLGYSRVGAALRRRSWADDPLPGALIGKRVLITGAGGGLGEAIALQVARLGAHVHLVGRRAARCEPARRRILEALAAEGEAEAGERIETEGCDVSDLQDVRRFGRELSSRLGEHGDALDVVIHNAGVLLPVRTESVDGHELSVATHVLGPVALTDALAGPLSRAAGGARVVLVSSGGLYTQALPVADPEFGTGRYRGAVAYARSKRMQVELLGAMGARWARHGVTVQAMHPGWVNTPGVRHSLPTFDRVMGALLRSPQWGADTAVWLAATSVPLPTSAFWHDRVPRPTSYWAATRPTAEQVDRLWGWVRQQLGDGPAG